MLNCCKTSVRSPGLSTEQREDGFVWCFGAGWLMDSTFGNTQTRTRTAGAPNLLVWKVPRTCHFQSHRLWYHFGYLSTTLTCTNIIGEPKLLVLEVPRTCYFGNHMFGTPLCDGLNRSSFWCPKSQATSVTVAEVAVAVTIASSRSDCSALSPTLRWATTGLLATQHLLAKLASDWVSKGCMPGILLAHPSQ